MKSEIALVYMVAGLSSRFGGKIKQFAKVGPNNETLIEHSINQALKSGFSKIIFIVGEKTEQPFRELFQNNYKNTPVHYALQNFDSEKRDRPWGTTDALCSAKHLLDCPFVVCNGDDLYGENTFQILADHLKNPENNHGATIGFQLIKVLPENGTVHRGIFRTKEDNHVKSITETFNIDKKNLEATNTTPEDLCSMNIYGLHPETLEHLNNILTKFKEDNSEDRKAECLLPNDISTLIQNNQLTLKLHPTPDQWFGITNPEDEEIVKQILRKNTTFE